MTRSTRIFRLVTAAALCLFGTLPGMPAQAAESRFTETVETVLNPGMGYTNTVWYRCKPGNTPVLNPTGSLVLMFVDIGAFSSGENGTKNEDGTVTGGTDYPFDDAFFAGLRGTFENCRRNGCTIALRFRYDDDGTQNPEPATFEMLKSHMEQLRESGIFTDYQDILMYVESGMVGCYGEQWGGKYCSLEQKAELLDLWLDIVPDPIPVTVRTPNIFAVWAGIKQAELADWTSEPGSRAARIGLYDDGYMGSDSDLGTYVNRETETAWLGRQTRTSYFGGEFSGNLEFAQKYSTYLPENAIPEMYRTHLSYINSNIFKLYQDYTFDKTYDVPDADNSAYYGQTVYKFMRDHLGYRFVLRSADVTGNAEQGGKIRAAFKVENTGFANPVREQKCEILLEKGGCFYRAPVKIDSRQWQSCTVSEETLDLQLPSGIEPGDWRVCLKLSIGENTTEQLALRSVQFANADTYDASLGANYLGTVRVSKSKTAGTVQTFHEAGSAESGGSMLYTVNEMQITDGIPSNAGETDAAILRGESKTAKLYITNDEDYLYVRAAFEAKAEAPVFNLEWTNPDVPEGIEKRYWLYYASNGYVYFNHGEPVGCLHKHSDGFAEFRIPLGEAMQLGLGTNLSGVRFFLQDSANEWALKEDVRAAEYTLTGEFPVYTAKYAAAVQTGAFLTLNAEVGLKEASRQWLKDGKPIAKATAQNYTILCAAPSDAGLYSVQITSPAGTVKTVDVCDLTVTAAGARGDVNGDGTVSIADAVALMHYLTGSGVLRQPDASDLNGDGKITATDLSMLKQLLCQKTSASSK